MNKYFVCVTLLICAFDLVYLVRCYLRNGDYLGKYIIVGMVPFGMIHTIIYELKRPDLPYMLVLFYMAHLTLLAQYIFCSRFCKYKVIT